LATLAAFTLAGAAFGASGAAGSNFWIADQI
jgi:hypothetical protein